MHIIFALLALLGAWDMGVGKLSVGTATDRVYLIGATGWFVGDWTPQAGDHLGTFAESALADYRAMKSYRDVTTIDTFTLKASKGSQNELIYITQELRRMLRKAIDYWTTDWQQEPVYIEAQADCETNIRYAIVHDARLVEDRNPYASPFMGKRSTMDGLALTVEHGPWLANRPGTGTCVQISGQDTYGTTQTTINSRPTVSTDDAYYIVSYSYGGTALFLGNTALAGATTGIRFPIVNIPQGANIISAVIAFVADQTVAVDTCRVKIYGEDYDDVATYASASDFKERVKTAHYVTWNNVEHYTVGNTYYTPNIASIIQEIVDRPGWVANNDLAIKFYDNGSDAGAYRAVAALDNLVRTEPILTVVYQVPTVYGRSATCNAQEVYIANKNNKANITHVYRVDGAAWSGNLLGTYTYDLLPTPVTNNDAAYFGCRSSLEDSGPFCSLVFDIGTAVTYTGAATLTWEYWNGAWVALTNYVDQTDSGDGPLSRAGVCSLHFDQPADWTTVSPGAGIPTGWWIRLRATIAGGDTISVPTQQSRDVYTITWGSILIDDAQIPGDVPALLRMLIRNPSSQTNIYSAFNLFGSDRLIMGLRQVDRGDLFSAYINLVYTYPTEYDQNPEGVNVLPMGSFPVTFPVSPNAPTGYLAHYDPAAAHGFGTLLSVLIQGNAAKDYVGRYHAYLRCRAEAGVSHDFGLRLAIGSVSWIPDELTYSDTAYTKHDQDIYEILDLGEISLPRYNILLDDSLYNIQIHIEVTTITDPPPAGLHLELIDLILIPIDEWAGEFRWLDEGIAGTTTYRQLGKFALEADGVSDSKNIRALLLNDFQFSTLPSGVEYAFRAIINSWPRLIPNKSQRLWMVTANPHWHTYLYRKSAWRTAHTIQMWNNPRYLSMRGNR